MLWEPANKVMENTLPNDDETPTFISRTGSVTGLIRKAKIGEVIAIERLTDKYLGQLTRFADQKLSRKHRQMRDENDIANEAIYQFIDGCMNGKYIGLTNRHQLWRLLAKITVCRVLDHHRGERAKKRGCGEVMNISNMSPNDTDFTTLDNCCSSEQSDPRFAVELREGYEQLIRSLAPSTVKIAKLSLEGFDNRQIAKKLRLEERTVRYHLDKIRSRINSELFGHTTKEDNEDEKSS